MGVSNIDIDDRRVGGIASGESPNAHRVAFITVGQSPREDVVPDILSQVDRDVVRMEYGVLDGLELIDMSALAPGPDDQLLVTRMRDGCDVTVSKPWVHARLQAMCDEVVDYDVDLVVLLSTGLFAEFPNLCATINAQRVIDRTIDAFALAGQKVGLIVPAEKQIDEVRNSGVAPEQTVGAAAPRRDAGLLREAVASLGTCDVVVMHSVGYDETDRAVVRSAIKAPVVLARRVLAGHIRTALDDLGATDGVPQKIHRESLISRLARLSRREREIMLLVADGLSNKEVARQLGISPRTVEIHRGRVMEKLEVQSLSELVRTVVRLGEL